MKPVRDSIHSYISIRLPNKLSIIVCSSVLGAKMALVSQSIWQYTWKYTQGMIL